MERKGSPLGQKKQDRHSTSKHKTFKNKDLRIPVFPFNQVEKNRDWQHLYFLNFNTGERPFLKILLLAPFPLRNAFCSS